MGLAARELKTAMPLPCWSQGKQLFFPGLMMLQTRLNHVGSTLKILDLQDTAVKQMSFFVLLTT